MRSRRTVAFLLRGMPTYRVAFFEQLRTRLAEDLVALSVAYSRPEEDHGHPTSDLEWAQTVPEHRQRVGQREVVWQPFLSMARAADLVVLLQQSRLLVNYLLLAAQPFGGPKVALWGHGEHMQSTQSSALAESVKRRASRWAHWWFAYNELTVEIVRGFPYPSERITDVQNAVDTTALREARAELNNRALRSIRDGLGITGHHIGIFCGTMYPLRQVPFLLRAADLVRAQIPDFELIVVGAGEQAPLVERAAISRPWIHYVGPKPETTKVPYFAIADVSLFSGPVGLGVVDSFALGSPPVVRASLEHNPEIAYVEHGVNSLLVHDQGEPTRYATAVVELLTDQDRLQELKAGALSSGERYTTEEMVDRFAEGLLGALEAPRRPGCRRFKTPRRAC